MGKRISNHKANFRKNRQYLEFFSDLVEEYAKVKSIFSKPKSRPQNWLSFNAGKYGFKYVWYFEKGNWPTVSFETGTQDKTRSKAFFEYLNKHQTELKKELPKFDTYNSPNHKHSSLLFYYSNEIDILSMSDEEKNKVMSWMVETMKKVEHVMSRYVDSWNA